MKGLNSSLAIVGSLGLSSVCVCVCTHALVGGPVPHILYVCVCMSYHSRSLPEEQGQTLERGMR